MRKVFQDVKKRRQLLVIISGGLILLSLAAGRLVGGPLAAKLLMTAAAVVAGADIALRAVNSLRLRHISIELLVTIAAAGALIIGEYWEAAAVTFLFIFGAYLEARTLSRTRQVLGDLLDLAPTTAIVLRDGRQIEIMPNEVQVGEVVWVKPGGKIAVDGEVIEGHSSVDESAITGEPMPEEKYAGSRVYAGTINQSGLIKVRATGIGADTTLARIIRRVEGAQDDKAPTQQFIERFARWYTPLIISLSAIVYLLTRNVELSLTLLVIGCPGALVISTPVSVVAGIGRAAKAGILIKGGEYLENAGKISAVALDKTGTLTQGKPYVTEIIAVQPVLELEMVTLPAFAGDAVPFEQETSQLSGRWSRAQQEVLRWAAVSEAGSEHPLARAILAESGQIFSEEIPAADRFETLPGKGILAEYQGRRIAVGSQDWMESQGISFPVEADAAFARMRSSGKTAVLVALDDDLLGILGISDPMRPSARHMVLKLKEAGIKRVIMLTGDDRVTAQAIAAEAGIGEVYAELLPDDKLERIRSLQHEGYVVAMTGDGINDAPALAAADIGIAMGAAGTDIAIETADIALMADDLLKIPEAIRLSKFALRNIHQNVVIALVTVAALLLGVLLSRVNMAGGMLVHEASVLVVILNGMRLLRA